MIATRWRSLFSGHQLDVLSPWSSKVFKIACLDTRSKWLTVRKRNNLTISVTLLDELPSMTTIVFSNKRQWCYATWWLLRTWYRKMISITSDLTNNIYYPVFLSVYISLACKDHKTIVCNVLDENICEIRIIEISSST